MRLPAARWFYALLATTLLVLPATGQATTEKSSIDRFNAGLEELRAHIRSASNKHKLGLVGLGGSDGGKTPTPGRACCSGNLARMHAAMGEMIRALDEMAACYERDGDTDGALVLALARTDGQAFGESVKQFENAPTKAAATTGIANITRTFLQLEETSKGLPACPASGDAASDGEAESEESVRDE